MTVYTVTKSDGELFELIANGDHQAFTEVYHRHSPLVYSLALQMLSDSEEAKDVRQQVFLKLLNKASLYFPDNHSPLSWLMKVTRNQAIDRIRQLKCRRSVNERIVIEASLAAADDEQSQSNVTLSDEVNFLHKAMDRLRPAESDILRLTYFRGLSQREIASQLRQPLGSVKARIRRSLLKLRRSLEEVMQRGEW